MIPVVDMVGWYSWEQEDLLTDAASLAIEHDKLTYARCFLRAALTAADPAPRFRN